MTISTTFGYNVAQDRLWISCAAWPRRVWITRRQASAIVPAVVARIEAVPPEADAVDAATAAARAAAAHDAALNQPQPGEHGRALQMGREAANAPALETALLCTRFALAPAGAHTELVFHTAAGQYRVRLSRTGLHRWLHALHLVLRGTGWADWPAPPEWLTRSYLPPALQSLLRAPLADAPPDSGGPDGQRR